MALGGLTSVFAEGPVDVYGEMRVKGQYFVGSKEPYTNAIVQVKGLSFFWNQWGGESQWNAGVVDVMVDEYGAEILRVPVSTSTGGRYADLNAAAQVIDRSIERGIYIVIDFHSHFAWDEIDEAKKFFQQAVERYGDEDNVIFETFNEPRTAEPHSWDDMKGYHDIIVKHIRDLGSDNLIIAGTPCLDQVWDGVKDNPVEDPDNNTAYALHFYTASPEHWLDKGSWIGDNLKVALKDKLPLFVTEWGTSHHDGGQDGNSFNGEKADEWHALLDEYGWSSAMWSIHSDRQSSAIWGNNGKSDTYIKGLLSDWKKIAPWRTGVVRPLAGAMVVSSPKKTLELPEKSTALTATIQGGKSPYGYKWSQSSGDAVDIGDSKAQNLKLDNLKLGTYTFLLKITDSDGQAAQTTIVVDVVNAVESVSSSSENQSTLISSSFETITDINDPDVSSSDVGSSEAYRESSESKNPPPGAQDTLTASIHLGRSSQINSSIVYYVSKATGLSIVVNKAGAYSIGLFDITGKKVYGITTEALYKGRVVLPLSNPLAEGLYVVKAREIQ